jgi:hypothetical protein
MVGVGDGGGVLAASQIWSVDVSAPVGGGVRLRAVSVRPRSRGGVGPIYIVGVPRSGGHFADLFRPAQALLVVLATSRVAGRRHICCSRFC